MADEETPRGECEYLRMDIHTMIRTRYANMTVAETVGILDLVKMDLWKDLERMADDKERGGG